MAKTSRRAFLQIAAAAGGIAGAPCLAMAQEKWAKVVNIAGRKAGVTDWT
jgi:hypothetical protein